MATYTQRTCLRSSPLSQFSRWLRMVSTQTAVLPVLRSPMINCRWPRPIGVIASMALIPVCSGSLDALALHHRRRLNLQRATNVGLDVSAAVDRLAERIDDAPQEPVADGHRQHFAGALDLLALFDLLEVTQDHRADAVLVEVERDAEDPARELEQLLGHDRGQAFDVRDAVPGVDDGTDLFAGGVGGEGAYVLLDGALDVISGDCQLCHGFSSSYLILCSRGVVMMVVCQSGN